MSSRAFLLANVLLLLSMGASCLLMVLSPQVNQQLRSHLRDVLAPALKVVESISPESARWSLFPMVAGQPESPAPSAIHDDRLQREILVLKNLLQQEKARLWQTESTKRLFQPELVHAQCLLPQQEERWRTTGWLDAGRDQRVAEQDWIISSELPLIDVGEDYGLHPDQLVLAGRQILGQIDQVGRWSSTYRRLTHAEFRCPAVILNIETGKRNDQAGGSLHGRGEETCLLKYVENTVPVSPGDQVVLADPQRRFDVPLILGTVISAELVQNSPFWEIQVAPAANTEPEKQVHVITERVNPARLLAN